MPSATPNSNCVKRIAIAIEMDYAYPWHHDCYQGILQYAEQRDDWLCVVDPFLVGMSGQADIKGYDGVVGRIDSEVAQIAQMHGIPVVNHWSNSPVPGLPAVLLDEIETGRLAGEHLVTCGYRRFAFAGIRDNRPGDKQFEGLTQAVTSKGFQAPDLWLYQDDFEESRQKLTHFRQTLIDWLAGLAPPVGVVAINATAARYLAQVCYERGLNVPKEVGIIVQSSDHSSDTGSPSITSVESDYMCLGYEAAKLLDELMQGKAGHRLQRIIAPTRLIARDSTDVFVCDDPIVKEAMHYIAERSRQTLKVEDIASALHTSESTLRRRFEKVLGRNVKDEIARLRTDRVKLMLAETDKPLSTIADEFGFSSAGQFTRYFSKAAGMTPSAYRTENQA